MRYDECDDLGCNGVVREIEFRLRVVDAHVAIATEWLVLITTQRDTGDIASVETRKQHCLGCITHTRVEARMMGEAFSVNTGDGRSKQHMIAFRDT